MRRPFRTTPLVPIFGEWAFWMLVALGIIGVLLLVGHCDDQARQDCERRGGQYVHVYKSSLCVKKGSVLE